MTRKLMLSGCKNSTIIPKRQELMFWERVIMFFGKTMKHIFLFWKHNAVCWKKKHSNFADIKKNNVSLQRERIIDHCGTLFCPNGNSSAKRKGIPDFGFAFVSHDSAIPKRAWMAIDVSDVGNKRRPAQ